MNLVEFILADGNTVGFAGEEKKENSVHTDAYGAPRLGVEPSSGTNQENPLTVSDYRYA
jgi:hypothetical protein